MKDKHKKNNKLQFSVNTNNINYTLQATEQLETVHISENSPHQTKSTAANFKAKYLNAPHLRPYCQIFILFRPLFTIERIN